MGVYIIVLLVILIIKISYYSSSIGFRTVSHHFLKIDQIKNVIENKSLQQKQLHQKAYQLDTRLAKGVERPQLLASQ